MGLYALQCAHAEQVVIPYLNASPISPSEHSAFHKVCRIERLVTKQVRRHNRFGGIVHCALPDSAKTGMGRIRPQLILGDEAAAKLEAHAAPMNAP